MSEKMSVAKEIKALALINIMDIFKFVITAKDDEIEVRYGTEERAINIAEKYAKIAHEADILEYALKGWSMEYSQPLKDSDDRINYKAQFYDTHEEDGEHDED